MATSTELTDALARAHAQVRAIDWTTWQVPPGDARLAEYLFAPEPPLTNGLVGTYLYFPSEQEVGAHIMDPIGHKAWNGEYEVNAGTIRLYDASDGSTNTSDFSSTPDHGHVTFHGKDFTRIGDTTNLRATGAE